jgi:transposase
MEYDHYIGVDWSQRNMSIARLTRKKEQLYVIDIPSCVKDLQTYCAQLKGTKILTIEESDTSQWLYTELKPFVDRLIVCDPYRNHLLKEGPKTDKIDAVKLVRLLKADLLKEVYHSGEEFIILRTLVSGYLDVIQAGVRFKNQRKALFRGCGQRAQTEQLQNASARFVLQGLEESIQRYERERERYQKAFSQLVRKYPQIRHVRGILGIGDIGAVKIVAQVVEANRFPSEGHFLSYCGLVRHVQMSGGKFYAQKNPRYCRMLKSVFKSAALAVIQKDNEFYRYYHHLMEEKNYPVHQARHRIARRIAVLAWGVLKSGKPYRGERKERNPKRIQS